METEGDLQAAMEAYQTAADYYAGEESHSSANQGDGAMLGRGATVVGQPVVWEVVVVLKSYVVAVARGRACSRWPRARHVLATCSPRARHVLA
eukprot:3733649-Prymnesium_polylepis.1